MKTITICFLISIAAFAQTKPVSPKPEAPVRTMTDKERGDFWLASYKAVQAELTLAKKHLEADEKLLLEPSAKGREAAGQAIVASCPNATLDAAGDIVCPIPVKAEAPKPAK